MESTPPSFYKLNSDGAAKGNPGKAGAGGIIRDSIGNWICGYSRRVGVTTSVEAELWGLRDGLVLVVRRRLSNLVVESDSEAVIRYVNEGVIDTHTHSTLISTCRKLMQQLKVDRVHHIYREASTCADVLAKMGVEASYDFVVFDEIPDAVKSKFCFDFMGTVYTREIMFSE